MASDNRHGGADKRHLAGFRKFQRAALKAVDIVARSLSQHDGDCETKAKAPVKVADMKSLVSAYKDAVIGERMVLGLEARTEGRRTDGWPDEMVVRWVDDDSQDTDGETADA